MSCEFWSAKAVPFSELTAASIDALIVVLYCINCWHSRMLLAAQYSVAVDVSVAGSCSRCHFT